MKMPVIGPGAIGTVVAAWLAREPSIELTVCARTPVEGLEVDSPSGIIRASPRVLVKPDSAEPVEWVLIATKAYDAEGAAGWLPGLLGPETRVAVLQNGVEHVARFAPYVDGGRITPCVVDIPAERTSPGRATTTGQGSEGGAAAGAGRITASPRGPSTCSARPSSRRSWRTSRA